MICRSKDALLTFDKMVPAFQRDLTIYQLTSTSICRRLPSRHFGSAHTKLKVNCALSDWVSVGARSPNAGEERISTRVVVVYVSHTYAKQDMPCG